MSRNTRYHPNLPQHLLEEFAKDAIINLKQSYIYTQTFDDVLHAIIYKDIVLRAWCRRAWDKELYRGSGAFVSKATKATFNFTA